MTFSRREQAPELPLPYPCGETAMSAKCLSARATHEHNWAGGPLSARDTLGAGVLRDCNDLKLLTGRADYIPNSFAHQKPCHWGYERNRTGFRVRVVLSHDTIFLDAPIVTPEGHRARKGNSVG